MPGHNECFSEPQNDNRVFSMHYWEDTPFWWHGFMSAAGMNIKSTQTVEVDGEDALMQTGRLTVDWNSSPDSEKDIDYLMVEGIGSVTHGCLPFFTYDMRTATRYFDYNLNRVYNDRGEIIYRGEDIDTSTLSLSDASLLRPEACHLPTASSKPSAPEKSA